MACFADDAVARCLRALTTPATLAAADNGAWFETLSFSRRHGLAGRWYAALEAFDALDGLDPELRAQLAAEHRVVQRRAALRRWEVHCISRVLATTGSEWLLLKGAAYAAVGVPHAESRLSADVDILVPEQALERVERAFLDNGWYDITPDPYDQHYFRSWMHELPPLRHRARGTIVDIHHNLLPRTSGRAPDPRALFEAAIAADGVRVLQPVDMVLHSVVHGFHDGEFTNPLRDVLDVYELIVHFAALDEAFWPRLTARATTLRWERPLAVALAAVRHVLSAEFPAAPAARPAYKLECALVLKALHQQIIAPGDGMMAALARRFLQARAHLNKMPPGLLVRHLLHKSMRHLAQRAPASAPAD